MKPKNRSLFFILFSLMAVLVLSACGTAAAEAAPAVDLPALAPEVSVDEAAALREEGSFILDVREPDEWTAGHIEGATLIPLGQLQNRTDEVPMDQQIVVYCRSGNRSQVGRDILLEAGFTSVTSMAGGFNDWSAAGYPFVTGE